MFAGLKTFGHYGAGGSHSVTVGTQCAHVIPWVVLVVVCNKRGGDPAADEKDGSEHSCDAEITETQEEVSCM
jgi:hypothetical protein